MNSFIPQAADYSCKGGNRMKKKLLAAVFGATLILSACGGGDKAKEEETPVTEPESQETASVDVEAAVDKSCIMCHGGNLEGGSAPALDTIGADLSEDEILDVIENGQGGMPGGLIKGEEAEAVAKWLSEKK